MNSLKHYKIGFILLLCLSSVFLSTVIYARGGCCSHHGGVVGCDSSVGRQLCRDGTDSPSCECQMGGASE